MEETGRAREPYLSLDGKVFCGNCGNEMVNTGQHYLCLRASGAPGGACTADPVYVDSLARLVLIRLLERLGTEETVQSVTANIIDATDAAARAQLLRMEQAEAEIARALADQPAVLQPAECGGNTEADTSNPLSELDQATAGPSFEYMVSSNELSKINFLRDQEGIQETVRDPNTFLAPDAAEESQELLELLVREVRVDAGSASVFYEIPLPSGDQLQGIDRDELPLQ